MNAFETVTCSRLCSAESGTTSNGFACAAIVMAVVAATGVIPEVMGGAESTALDGSGSAEELARSEGEVEMAFTGASVLTSPAAASSSSDCGFGPRASASPEREIQKVAAELIQHFRDLDHAGEAKVSSPERLDDLGNLFNGYAFETQAGFWFDCRRSPR